MTSILGLYSAAFARRPMATQSTTSAIIFGTGDIIAQQVVDRKGFYNHDVSAISKSIARFGGRISCQRCVQFTRTARFVFYGACLFGPVLTKWHQFINRRHFTSPLRAVVYKVTLDQLVAAPFITVPMFFGSMSILEGRPDEAISRIRNVCPLMPKTKNQPIDLVMIVLCLYINAWLVSRTKKIELLFLASTPLRCLFIPAQIVNFAFVPVPMRILFFSTVALCWNTYLSFFNAKQKRLQERSP
ncbi:hypothetical protein DFJ43DRAFT_1034272 [Lentinula guzmanii]|uniref:Protein Mpv17 n=1 Tax=Lentinula guzmanii TaxID=2804957 RepID=A0AA38J3E6_9AGAR|nr:hypothetical protein DFJ43DRAFT_1034272 [Lentinula guzmanii]